MLNKIAIVIDPSAMSRLAAGMFAGFKPGKVFLVIDALRPSVEIVARLKDWNPDGIIVRMHPETNQRLLKLHKPMVICGGNRVGRLLSSVVSDATGVATAAARHLIDLGLRNFAYFGNQSHFSLQRQRGYVEALHAAGHRCDAYLDVRKGWEHYMELSLDDKDDAELSAWLKKLPKPVGIFAAHDPLGWHLSQVCRQAGVPVPEDVAIVSANNDEVICKLSSPPLSSVAIPWDRVGEEAALALENLMVMKRTNRRGDLMGRLVRVQPHGVVTRQSSDIVEVGNRHLRSALAFIRLRSGDSISVEDILAAVPVSRRKLENDFRFHLNRSPKEEITRVRIERAKWLLVQSELPISTVAKRCGYMYPERFTVAFRRATGSTPVAFRRGMKPRSLPEFHRG